MGMFADVRVDTSIDLPNYPDSIERTENWQSKEGLDVYGGPYRITEEGRLEKKELTFRNKTDTEKQQEAERWGFDSWDAFVASYDESEDIFPEDIDYPKDGEYPPIYPLSRTTDEEWWEDQNFHGSFEFHTAHSVEEGTLYVKYRARFEQGNLTNVILETDEVWDANE